MDPPGAFSGKCAPNQGADNRRLMREGFREAIKPALCMGAVPSVAMYAIARPGIAYS